MRGIPSKSFRTGTIGFASGSNATSSGHDGPTLESLCEQARRSARLQWATSYRSVWKERLRQLWTDYERHSHCKQQIGSQIERLYLRLQERVEEPAPFEQISAKQLGRLVGELGPLDDFDTHQEVEKYVGLNL